MKKLYFSLVLCFIFNLSIAQVSASWQNYFNDALVKIEFKEIDIQESNSDVNKKLIVFKLSNLTACKLSINWQQKLQYGAKCYNCTGNSSEMNFTVSLEPNEIKEGNPESHLSDGLVILKKFNAPQVVAEKVVPLTSYELKNIQVSSIIN
jgi:hypothetical protein